VPETSIASAYKDIDAATFPRDSDRPVSTISTKIFNRVWMLPAAAVPIYVMERLVDRIDQKKVNAI
jgi:hypothetical protein